MARMASAVRPDLPITLPTSVGSTEIRRKLVPISDTCSETETTLDFVTRARTSSSSSSLSDRASRHSSCSTGFPIGASESYVAQVGLVEFAIQMRPALRAEVHFLVLLAREDTEFTSLPIVCRRARRTTKSFGFIRDLCFIPIQGTVFPFVFASLRISDRAAFGEGIAL